MGEIVVHPLMPLYDENTRVLILGTMPSPASRQRSFYYAHPQNRFWPVLAEVLKETCPKDNEERRALVLRHGIGLWDVLHSCAIEGAADGTIREPVANDIASLLEKTNIRAIFTTGQTAYRLYTRLCEAATGIPAVVLPSTSPANCACKYERLVLEYSKILEYTF